MRGKTPTIHCDGEDGYCGNWDVDYYEATVSAINGMPVTSTVRAPGWTVTEDDGDLCPKCTPTTAADESGAGA